MKINSHLSLLSIIGLSILTSCGSSDSEANKSYTRIEDAWADGSKMLSELRAEKDMTVNKTSLYIIRWNALRDSAAMTAARDTASAIKPLNDGFSELYSAAFELVMDKKMGERKWGFADYLAIREKVISAEYPKAKVDEDCMSFIETLDSAKVAKVSPKQMITDYLSMIDKFARNGVNNIDELKAYLRQEDIHFRRFLACLSEVQGEQITPITQATEMLSKKITESVHKGKMNENQTLLLMSMRSNRRLIQNAKQCISDLKNGKVKSGDSQKKAAYMWMTIQPLVAMDDYDVCQLSKEQKQDLNDIANYLDAQKKEQSLPGLGVLAETQIKSLLIKQ